ncbi:S26 family signal peptidase [Rhodopirellula sp. SWK7]|uniref:S26 family signal peptidase n=1 Tax=Rhodopirellula sp. SWK7 TaxID=595460 RepID=UPI0002BDDEBB|nr:S26 family signal peptidase [Rhodopirellula sp. SWK7]EMI44448.1 signal peptidase [Rhodopirellula sp. SWK7]
MTLEPPNRYSRRELASRSVFTATVGALTTGAAGVLALAGCSSESNPSARTQRYRVSGPSMIPTLWDASDEITCQQCELVTRVDRQILKAAMERSVSEPRKGSAIVCWHCGTDWDGDYLSSVLTKRALQPDLIEVVACDTGRLRTGDVVLVRRESEPSMTHVKRVLATPGQTVSYDEFGQLLVDGERPWLPSLGTIPVDFDSHRESSRWQNVPRDAGGDVGDWTRQHDRSWTSWRGGTLIYEHRTVYRGDRPVRVLDDYPSNLGIDRRLFPADGLSVRFRLSVESNTENSNSIEPGSMQETDEKTNPAGMDIAGMDFAVWIGFWTPDGIKIQSRSHRFGLNESLDLRFHAGLASLPDVAVKPANWVAIGDAFNDQLSPTQPIGLMLERRLLYLDTVKFRGVSSPNPSESESILRIRDLRVERDVLYREDRNSGGTRQLANQSTSPGACWRLGADEWFVVGDNVPLSIDSRRWGGIRSREIVGLVNRTDRSGL